MQPKKNPIFISHKIEDMPNFLYRSRFIIVIVFSILLLLAGCSKNPASNPVLQNFYQQYFEQNILNRDYRVQLATDNGVDLTAQYSGYTFRMLETTLYNGTMTASNGPANYTGTWSCNDDYSKLVITLPASPPEFVFLTREWKFTKKDIPIMELAPWGTTEPKVLHMERL